MAKLIAHKKQDNAFFAESEIVGILSNIALGLQQIHKNGIIHRDLKPQNIFICESQAKIGDFGVSGVLKSGSYLSSKSGTFAYMAPEMLNSNKYTNAVDVWSLGCIAYEMCELKMPFNGSDPPMVLIQNISEAKYSPISNKYSQKLRNLIVNMLIVEPHKRVKIDEIVAILSDFYFNAWNSAGVGFASMSWYSCYYLYYVREEMIFNCINFILLLRY